LCAPFGRGCVITRELIRRKIVAQERLVREKLKHELLANQIASHLDILLIADSVDAIRQIEGQASFRYWQAWETVAVTFAKADLVRVPEHWLTFGTRRSPLSKNARGATTPANALLNYLYPVLESEARLAVNALGLDAGLGLLHADTASHDSLVYDLMEPVRPQVDAYLIHWISQSPLKRASFFEEGDGKCRVMDEITKQLTFTTDTWSREIAPVAEWFLKELCPQMLDMTKLRRPGTRLTQERRRVAVGSAMPIIPPAPNQQNVCKSCAALISATSHSCVMCARGGAQSLRRDGGSRTEPRGSDKEV
jgi:hypothetical protein